MSKENKKDFLLKIDDDGSFVTVAGLRMKTTAFNGNAVDLTHAESSGRWRELLAGAGVRRASLSASGIFKDAASDALVRERLAVETGVVGFYKKIPCYTLTQAGENHAVR